MDTDFRTAKDVARILKISKALAYRLISQGQIPSIRFGKTVRVKSGDLQRFIEQSISTLSQVRVDSTKQNSKHRSKEGAFNKIQMGK